ncbi:MAG: hypothetical protein AAF752_13510 [Bacteroidota bacterium]
MPFFHFDHENNPPTCYSALLHLMCALLTGLAARSARSHRWYWGAVTVAFLYSSFDEVIRIHERFSVHIRPVLDTSGFFYFAWIIPYSVLVIVGLALIWPWLRSLPKRTRLGFVAAAGVFVFGAVVMEGLLGFVVEDGGIEADWLMYSIFTTIEESLEIFGLLIYITTALRYHVEVLQTSVSFDL